MSNIYVFYVSVSASVAKRRKFEEVIGQRLVPAANLLLEISAGALVGCGFVKWNTSQHYLYTEIVIIWSEAFVSSFV